MSAAPARYWLAGFVEITAHLVSHVADGLEALAEVLDPHTPTATPTVCARTVVDGDHTHHFPADRFDHEESDECPCGPAMRHMASGSGDHWTITHHPLQPPEDA